MQPCARRRHSGGDRGQTSDVSGVFDAGALAAAGRHRAQRRRLALGGALAGVLVMVLGGGVWGLVTWADQPHQAVVADTTSLPTSAPAAPTSGAIAPVEISADTSG